MRKLIAVGVACAGLMGAAVAQPPANPTPPPGPMGGNAGKEFTGVWAPVSSVYAGEEMMPTAEAREKIRMTVANGLYSMFAVVDPKEGTGQRLATASFDVDARAKTFVLTFQGGVKHGEKVHGVFELAGDELKLCYTPEKNPRPTKFESPKESAVFCETWKRIKK